MGGPVVVGVDGSPSSPTAVETVVREAERSGTGLRSAHALTRPSAHFPHGVPPWDQDAAGTRETVAGPLDAGERRPRRTAPGVTVTQDVLIGEPSTVPEPESRPASLAVVGSRSRASVAGVLTAGGNRPVLVVVGRPEPDGPVVPGDDSLRAAAGFAFSEGARRNTDLVLPRLRLRTARPLTALPRKYPDTVVHDRRARTRTERSLVVASAAAQRVVIEARPGAEDAMRAVAPRTLVDHEHGPLALVGAGAPARKE